MLKSDSIFWFSLHGSEFSPPLLTALLFTAKQLHFLDAAAAACCPRGCDTPTAAERAQAAAEGAVRGEEGRKGGVRQMEIDGEGEREIKRNMPLGVTGERARVRGMRGLQACEPHMGLKKRVREREKNKIQSRQIFLGFLPPSLLFPLVTLSSWERRSIFV